MCALCFSLLIYWGFNHTGGPSLSARVRECDTVLIAAHWQYWTRVTWCGCMFKNTEYAPDSLWNWFPMAGREHGGLTKSYYAGQDVLIVLQSSDAEHTR